MMPLVSFLCDFHTKSVKDKQKIFQTEFFQLFGFNWHASQRILEWCEFVSLKQGTDIKQAMFN